MSSTKKNDQLPTEKVIELAEAGKIPQALRDFWKQEHGIDSVEAAKLTQEAIELERVQHRLYSAAPYIFLAVAVALIQGQAIWPTVFTEAVIGWVVGVGTILGVFLLLRRDRALEKRSTANRRRGKSVWEFVKAFDEFTDLIRPAELGSVAHYSHQGLKDLVERELRAVALLILKEEASLDEALPSVMRVTNKTKSLHWGLRESTEQMKVLGLSDGDFGRYYKLAKRDLK